jgi:hypothetical protein
MPPEFLKDTSSGRSRSEVEGPVNPAIGRGREYSENQVTARQWSFSRRRSNEGATFLERIIDPRNWNKIGNFAAIRQLTTCVVT